MRLAWVWLDLAAWDCWWDRSFWLWWRELVQIQFMQIKWQQYSISMCSSKHCLFQGLGQLQLYICSAIWRVSVSAWSWPHKTQAERPIAGAWICNHNSKKLQVSPGTALQRYRPQGRSHAESSCFWSNPQRHARDERGVLGWWVQTVRATSDLIDWL